MCGNFLGGLFGGGERDTPPVVYSSPRADQERADAEAASRSAQDRTKRRRAQRASSLLATGGQGDLGSSGIAAPSASGNATLGGR
jgi:hypothetical protein